MPCFFSKLLNKNPERRLGHPELGGPLAIREHDFFTDINWVDMYLKKTEPPLKSFMTIKSDLDLINFDNLPDDNEQVRNIFTNLLIQVVKKIQICPGFNKLCLFVTYKISEGFEWL